MNRNAHSLTRRHLALLLMVISGFAALSYQIIWTQQSAVWLGHETASVFAVVSAFFGGIALGALTFSSRVDRSPSPGLWYAGCEIVIGLWSVILAFAITPMSSALLMLIGPQPAAIWHWSVAFVGTFLILLPATAAMGTTLPAMERLVNLNSNDGSPIPYLYAANTFGAVLGVLACAFAMVPLFGLKLTALMCATLNVPCAVIAFRLMQSRSSSALRQPAPNASGSILFVMALTGLLGIGYEVLVVRALSQVAENTVYTFALLLAVYLIGTTAGAAAYGRWISVLKNRERAGDILLLLLALSCLFSTLGLSRADSLKESLLHLWSAGMTAALTAEALLAVIAFLLPTILMGALFSHLSIRARERGIGFGRALGVNTLGAAFAPAIFSLLLVVVAPKFSLLLVAVGYIALVSRRAWFSVPTWLAVGAATAFALWAPSLVLIHVPENGRIVSYKEGALATVSVVEDARGVATLHINNRQQEGSTATHFADGRQALLPLLLHPAPQKALMLGVGTGVSASVAADDRSLSVDAVELLPEVVDATRHFIGAEPNPRLNFMVADARRFVRSSKDQYDIIVSDNFHPARSGSASLYTVEHFHAVQERLAAGGLFCQWLPLHQLDLDSMRSIVRSFIQVYPNGWAMLATNSLDTPVVGLVSHRDDGRFDLVNIQTRLRSIAMSHAPSEYGITDELALLGGFIAGPRSLARFANGAPPNTDDHPLIAYRAPRLTYEPSSQPRDRLIALLNEVEISPNELLLALGDAALHEARGKQLVAYWNARDRFIEAGRTVQPTADVRRMLAQVREPLLSTLRVSPEFRPAYDPLLRMAIELARVDVPAAQSLFMELQSVSPGRAEAAQYLQQISEAIRN